MCCPIIDVYMLDMWKTSILKRTEKEKSTGETVRDFILGGSKITADSDCSHEIKRHSSEGKL